MWRNRGNRFSEPDRRKIKERIWSDRWMRSLGCGDQMRTAPGGRRSQSDFLLGLEDLAAAIHAGLEIDVVRAAQFAGILVLDIGRRCERVGGAAHPAPRRRSLSFRDGHGSTPVSSVTGCGGAGSPGYKGLRP